MADLGLVTNFRNAQPDRNELGALGITTGWTRSIVYSFSDLDAALAKIDPRTKVCALLNSETEGVGGNYQGWAGAVARIATNYQGRVQAVECGNELDLLDVPVVLAANLVNTASGILRAAGMKVILTSVAGAGWVTYMETLASRTAGAADYACLHPYGQRSSGFPAGWGFGELADVIATAHSVSGLPVVLTEYGIKIGDAGGEQGQAEYVRRSAALLQALSPAICPFACYFAWRDDIGGPTEQGSQAFGLRRLDGSPRPAWQEFALAHNQGGSPKPPPDLHPTFQLGFAEWAAKDRALLGDPIENERGGVPGFSVQKTTKGRLMAQYLAVPETNAIRGWTLTFWSDADGSRWLYRQDRSEQIA